MDRRPFVGWVGLGWVASSLPVAIAISLSNSANSTESSQLDASLVAEETKSNDFQVAGTVANLDQSGFLLNQQLKPTPVLIIRNPTDAKTLIAVNPTCTHRGCTVNWKAADSLFECPCHRSKFALDGMVVKGPAKRALATYTVKVDGNSILVRGS
jgi:cytochrome b6-f complex iron-sulfur subunit